MRLAISAALALAVATLLACSSTTAISSSDPDTLDDQWNSTVVDRSWLLKQIESKDALEGATVTLSFMADGTLAGSGGANRLFGRWYRNAAALRLTNVASTKRYMDSPPGTMAQESKFLSLLAMNESWSLKDKRLHLRRGDRDLLIFSPMAVVKGTVTYVERMLVPPNAQVKVELVEVTENDAAPQVVAEQVVPTQGKGPPYEFKLEYDTERIGEKRSYAVRASILVGDKVWFTTPDLKRVITDDHPTEVEITVRREVGDRPRM